MRRTAIATVLILLLAATSRAPRVATQDAPQPVVPMSIERANALIDAAAEQLDYAPGEVLVKFKEGMSPRQQQRALDVVRGRPSLDALEWVGEVAILRDPVERDANVIAAQLSGRREVEYAEPNYIRHVSMTPNDPAYSQRQWNFDALDMPRAWDINPGANSGMIVAVVDTGVTTVNTTQNVATWNGSAIQRINVNYAVNPDLSASRLVSPMDFATGGGTTVLDSEGHGTHVSGTIGEDTNNGLAEAGIAYQARIMPVKVCSSYWDVQFSFSGSGGRGFVPLSAGGCFTSDIAAGVRYAADNGAKVINLSLGGTQQSQTELDAINYAVGKGAFVAMAAGNTKESGNLASYPAANAPNIAGAVAVAATNKSGNRAYYSTTGTYVEVAAPGGDDRDSDAAGSGYIWQSTLRPSATDPRRGVVFPTFDSYGDVGYEGTSMATPHVAGLAALLMTQGVTAPAAVEALMKKTAKVVGSPASGSTNRNDEVGFGIIQPRTALFGFGIRK